MFLHRELMFLHRKHVSLHWKHVFLHRKHKIPFYVRRKYAYTFNKIAEAYPIFAPLSILTMMS